MYIKNERGFSAIDISIAIICITIFMAVIANLLVNINLYSKNIERKTVATSYAIQEIEEIKALGYIDKYNGKGIDVKEELFDYDSENILNDYSDFTKKVFVEDYVLIKNDATKKVDLVKELTVEISYSVSNREHSVSISTYVVKLDTLGE